MHKKKAYSSIIETVKSEENSHFIERFHIDSDCLIIAAC